MTAFLSYLVLLEFGTGTLMTRNLSLLKRDGSDEDAVNKNISTIWTMTIALSCIIVVFAFVFWLLIGVIYSNSMTAEQIDLGKKIFIFAAGHTVFSFLTTTLNGVLMAYERYLVEKTLQLIKLLLRVGLLIVLLTSEANVMFVSIVDFSLAVLVFVLSAVYCISKLKVKLVFRYFDKDILKSCLPLAFAMLLQTIVNVANGNVDKFCISVMMTPEDVSVYSISMTIFTMFASVATVPITMFMPTIAKNVKAGLTDNELTKTLVEPCRFCVMITGLILFGFIVVGRQFLSLVYGEDFEQSWFYAVIVIVPMFVNMTNGVVVNVLDLKNKRHIQSFILLGTTIVNIIMTVLGIMHFGMIAAATATAIALVIQTVLLGIFYQQKIGIRVMWLYHQSYKGIIPFYIIAGAIAFGLSYPIEGRLLQLLICGTVFVVIAAALVISFGLTDSEKQKCNGIIRKVFSKKS